MTRVLVVDDEPRQRKILSNVIREYRQNYEVLEAKNGEEALALCRERTMDLVFSDIRMPKMDGLSLIEQLCEMNRQSRIVVVSGYSDFNYARKALDLRVYSYLLKPIERSVIWEIITQIEEEIEKAKNNEMEINEMAEQLNLILPFYRDHLMSKWIKGECSKTELAEVEESIGFRGRGCLVLTRLTSQTRVNNDSFYTNEDMEEIRSNIKVWISEVLYPYGYLTTFSWKYNTNCIVSLLNCSAIQEDTFGKMIIEMQTLTNSLLHEYGILLSTGVGAVQEEILSFVQQAFTTAEAALSCQFYMNSGRVSSYSNIRHLYQEQLKISFPYEEDLKQFVQGHKPFSFDRLEHGLKILLDNRCPEPESVLENISSLMKRIHHSIKHIISEETDGHLIQKIKKLFNPYYCTSLDQLKKQWFELLEEMADGRSDPKSSQKQHSYGTMFTIHSQ